MLFRVYRGVMGAVIVVLLFLGWQFNQWWLLLLLALGLEMLQSMFTRKSPVRWVLAHLGFKEYSGGNQG
jgi:hypothetical protein